MKKINTILPLLIISILCNQDLYSANSINLKKIITEIDKLYRSSTSYATIEMKVVTPNWQRKFELDVWSKGMNKTFIRIKTPKKDRGISTLRVKTEMWNFFPKINKVLKVPPSMMMGSWMGSDFTNDDLVKESTLVDDYDSKLINKDSRKDKYFNIILTPKKDTPTIWDKIELLVRRNDFLPVSQKYFDEKGRLLRILEFSDIKNFSGRILPSVLTMTRKNKKGYMTTIRYLNISFDVKPHKNTFTLRNLQKRR